MIGLFRKSRTPSGKEAALPRGKRVYAVGDIHGRADLLDAALELIERDDSGRLPAETILVFLGDLIDRGPDSAQVVERVRNIEGRWRLIALAGNHEEVLIRVLRGETKLIGDWLRFGGAECAASYGIDPTRLGRAEPAEALAMLRAAMPAAHVNFIEGLGDTFQVGDYLFVHAGIRPGVPLSEQLQSDLRWIRGPFLACGDDHGAVVVHGHTISSKPEIRPNRIGIDTGAYKSGVLTVLGLEADQQWLIQTGRMESEGIITVSDQDMAEAEGRC